MSPRCTSSEDKLRGEAEKRLLCGKLVTVGNICSKGSSFRPTPSVARDDFPHD